MSKGNKVKQAQTTNQSGAQSSQTNVTGSVQGTAPDWVQAAIQGAMGRVNDVAGQDPSKFVAGSNDILDRAGAGAAGLGGAYDTISGAMGRAGALTGSRDVFAGALDDVKGLGDLSGVFGGQAGNIAGLQGTQGGFDTAVAGSEAVRTASAPQTQAVQAKGYIDDYQDPYEARVLDATKARYEADEGDQLAQLDLNLAGSGAFGGSGAFLERGKFRSDSTLNKNKLLSDIGSAGFAQALAAAQQDAGRAQGANDLNANLKAQQLDRSGGMARQIADLFSGRDANARANAGAVTDITRTFGDQARANAGLSADLATGYEGNERANAGAMADLARIFGGEQRADIGLQGDMGQLVRQIQGEQARAPLDLAAFGVNNLPQLLQGFFGENRTGATNSTGTSSGTSASTGTTKEMPGAMQTAGDIAAIASLFVKSDRRIKRDVKLLGRRADGLGLYLFKYLWDDVLRIGVMAQEVLKVRPWAVATHPDGYLMVNYRAL